MRNDVALSPWSEINRMWNLMDRYWPNRELELASAAFPIDMYQQEGQLFVRASMPGVKPEDLQVSLEQNTLTITGETNEPFKEQSGGRLFHREHSYGKFVRSVRMPSDIDESAIEAQFENGVLTVTLPLVKQQQAQPKQIPIRGVSSGRSIEANAYADRPKDGVQKSQAEREKVAK